MFMYRSFIVLLCCAIIHTYTYTYNTYIHTMYDDLRQLLFDNILQTTH